MSHASTQHRYKIGDTVTMKVQHRGAKSGRGVFKIVKTMPASDDGFQYRIRDEQDWREHVAQESQLTPAPQGPTL